MSALWWLLVGVGGFIVCFALVSRYLADAKERNAFDLLRERPEDRT